MFKQAKQLPIYYIAVLMPDTGRNANQVKYYKASNDLRRVLYVEQIIDPLLWKQKFIESLLVVTKRKYHYPLSLEDNVVMASLAKVIGVTSHPPFYYTAITRSQFVLPEFWTTMQASATHLRYVQHDYNTATKHKIHNDWQFWRQEANRTFALTCYHRIRQAFEI
ncbi:hypothetical protein LNP18_06490 [Leuconostoc citreum]|uniref:DUF7679 family protein n=1 Tax=Leuconostoc citreum TaxID=33964 RepID=UPI002009F3B9|nr:hypothetical protein [Leuconostoc citreum]MCK8605752.1 hypothetical protein [Leuconostoc citreum]